MLPVAAASLALCASRNCLTLHECTVQHVPELRDELQVSEERPQQAGVLGSDQSRLERDAEALLLNVHLQESSNVGSI